MRSTPLFSLRLAGSCLSSVKKQGSLLPAAAHAIAERNPINAAHSGHFCCPHLLPSARLSSKTEKLQKLSRHLIHTYDSSSSSKYSRSGASKHSNSSSSSVSRSSITSSSSSRSSSSNNNKGRKLDARRSLLLPDVSSLSSSQQLLRFAASLHPSYLLNTQDVLLLLQQLFALQPVRSSSSSFRQFWQRAFPLFLVHRDDPHFLRLSLLLLSDLKCSRAVLDIVPLVRPHLKSYSVLQLVDLLWRAAHVSPFSSLASPTAAAAAAGTAAAAAAAAHEEAKAFKEELLLQLTRKQQALEKLLRPQQQQQQQQLMVYRLLYGAAKMRVKTAEAPSVIESVVAAGKAARLLLLRGGGDNIQAAPASRGWTSQQLLRVLWSCAALQVSVSEVFAAAESRLLAAVDELPLQELSVLRELCRSLGPPWVRWPFACGDSVALRVEEALAEIGSLAPEAAAASSPRRRSFRKKEKRRSLLRLVCCLRLSLSFCLRCADGPFATHPPLPLAAASSPLLSVPFKETPGSKLGRADQIERIHCSACKVLSPGPQDLSPAVYVTEAAAAAAAAAAVNAAAAAGCAHAIQQQLQWMLLRMQQLQLQWIRLCIQQQQQQRSLQQQLLLRHDLEENSVAAGVAAF
ncbi:hypothetical protein Efla_007031 [Eimeria flavescens]